MRQYNMETPESPKIILGRQGEKNAESLIFDCTSWAKKHGADTVELWVQRNPDEAPCLVSLSPVGLDLIWEPSKEDMAKAGEGKAWIVCKAGAHEVRSEIIRTEVTPGSL